MRTGAGLCGPPTATVLVGGFGAVGFLPVSTFDKAPSGLDPPLAANFFGLLAAFHPVPNADPNQSFFPLSAPVRADVPNAASPFPQSMSSTKFPIALPMSPKNGIGAGLTGVKGIVEDANAITCTRILQTVGEASMDPGAGRPSTSGPMSRELVASR